jgi:hypothetical protein
MNFRSTSILICYSSVTRTPLQDSIVTYANLRDHNMTCYDLCHA